VSRVVIIPEVKVPGKRLGRMVEHDSRSRAFEATTRAAPLVSKAWTRHIAPFDQGDLGSCTGNAMAGCLATEPFFMAGRVVDEALAVQLYSAATRLDYVPGHYPPEDTGSSGLAVAKAAARLGLVSSYHHAFGLHGALAALGHVGPVVIGVNWYESFDSPQGPHAELVASGSVRGGHEVQLLAVDLDQKLVRGCNSWGNGWGDGGYFTMGFSTLERLLAEQGDCVVPVP
jgi:hypothetical protein